MFSLLNFKHTKRHGQMFSVENKVYLPLEAVALGRCREWVGSSAVER